MLDSKYSKALINSAWSEDQRHWHFWELLKTQKSQAAGYKPDPAFYFNIVSK